MTGRCLPSPDLCRANLSSTELCQAEGCTDRLGRSALLTCRKCWIRIHSSPKTLNRT